MLGEEGGVLLSLLGALAAVAAVLVLAYLFTRYIAGRTVSMGAARGRRRMTLVEQLPLGRDQKLLLVRLGESYLLLGVAQNSVSCLKELTGEEAELLESASADGEAPPSFQGAMRRVWEQRKR